MASENTIAPSFYSIWPNLGKKFSQQLGEIRTDTSSLAPIVRAVGFDADGDWSDLSGIAENSVQAYEIGEQDFHNRFRLHYDKDDALLEVESNTGTETVPNWYTIWTINNDGYVTQLNTPTTASNVGGGAEVFKAKVGVDLVHRTLTATSPITLTENANTIDIDGSALVSTYSSDQAAAPSGDANVGVEIILSDTGKVGNDLPFKAIKAGPNVVVTNTGTAIQIESTAQIVEFYGIHVGHDDGSKSYNEVHNFLVNREDFYITQQTTNPSNKTIILNSISDPFNSTDYVAVIGDDMTGPLAQADGSAALPSYTFTNDTSMGFSRNAADDLGVSIGGSYHSRFLSDRLLTKQLQITNTGSAAAPDLYFFPDSDTGIFQQELDSIAFTTGGTRAGLFTSNQDFYVTGRILVGNGSQANPSVVFGSDQELGLNRESAGILNINSAGAARLQVASDEIVPTVPIRPNFDGTAGSVAYGWDSDVGTGFFLATSSGNSTLALAVDTSTVMEVGVNAGQFKTFLPIRTTVAGTEQYPSYSWFDYTGTGLYNKAASELGFSTGASLGGGSYAGHIDASQKWWFDNDIDVSSGDVTVQTEVYGAGWDGDNTVPTKDAVYDKIQSLDTDEYFDNIYVTDTVHAGRVEAGVGVFYTALTVDGQILAKDYDGQAAPAYSFIGDEDTGYGHVEGVANKTYLITGGQINLQMFSSWNRSVQQHFFRGGAAPAVPAIGFWEDANTGIYQLTDDDDAGAGSGDGTIAFSSQGAHVGHWDVDGLHVEDDLMAGRVEAGIGNFYISLSTADDIYSESGWDGNLTVPTKNAIRDKLQSIDTFYLTAKHSDDTESFSDFGILAFNVNDFYLTQLPTNTDEVMINVRGYTRPEDSPTWTGDHTFSSKITSPLTIGSMTIDTEGNVGLTDITDTNNDITFHYGNVSFSGGVLTAGRFTGEYYDGNFIEIQAGHITGVRDIDGSDLDITAGTGDYSSTGTLSAGALTCTTIDTGTGARELDQDVISGSSPTFTGTNITAVASVTAADESADSTCFPLFVTDATGTVSPKTNSGFIYDATANQLVVTSMVSVTSVAGTLTWQSGQITDSNGAITFGNEDLSTTGTLGAGAITGTSFIIGGNTLDTNEWAFLDGQDQGVKIADAPTFAGATFTGLVSQVTFTSNVSYGSGAGALLESGALRNTLIGANAGTALTIADDNTFVGYNAGVATVETGHRNTFFGSLAGESNITGDDNVLFGYNAGNLSTVSGNVCIGSRAGQAMTTSTNNTFIGSSAGAGTEDGIGRNVYIGKNAGEDNATGNSNVAIGYGAGSGAGAEYANATMIGYQAGIALTSGTDNLFFGNNAGVAVTTGSNNVLFNSTSSLEDGNNNILIGINAGSSNVSGDDNVCVGNGTGRRITSSRNTMIGAIAGGVGNPLSGVDNVYLGYYAGGLTTSANRNIFIGPYAGRRQTTADDMLLIHNVQEGNAADELTSAIIYGVMNNTPSSQVLTLNANTNVTYGLDVTGISNLGDGGTTDYSTFEADGKLVFVGTAGLAFAEIFVKDSAATISLDADNADVLITQFTTNGQSNNCTADAANDKITFTKIGKYLVTASVVASIDVGAATTLEISAYLNGAEQTQVHACRDLASAAGNGSISLCGIIDVTTASWDLDLRANVTDTNARDIILRDLNLSVVQIGGT